jgi:uncharacterized MAPEG superfamily protein
MTLWILGVLGLWLAQVFLAASFKTVLAPDRAAATADHMRGKDHPPEVGVMGGRAERARVNLQESLPVFLGLALLHEIHGPPDLWAQVGAGVFLVGRVLYVPAYLSAIFGVRSGVWMVAMVGLALMAGALFL